MLCEQFFISDFVVKGKRKGWKSGLKFDAIRAAVLQYRGTPPMELKGILARQGVDVPVNSIHAVRHLMRKEGIELPSLQRLAVMKKSIRLDSREAAISRAIYYNQNLQAKEIQKLLAKQGIRVTITQIRSTRHFMRRGGIKLI